MPYIPKDQREQFEYCGETISTVGQLNFVLTSVARDYLDEHGLSYRTINDILGAFDGASKEFYRRVAAPYEDGKIKENGDVY